MTPVAEKTKSSWGARIFLSCVLVLLLAPGPLWLVLRQHLDTTNYENRILALFPADVEPTQWPAAFEAWLGDHAPFRNQLMSLNTRINRWVGSLESSDVLLGEEGWLFLKDVSDSKSLSDYQGLTAYSPEELEVFSQRLLQLQQALADRNSRLVVVLAPAKEGVCSRYMPDTIPRLPGPTRVQTLARHLSDTGLAVVWPQEALISAQQTRQTYYRYDTHWNEAGAYVAADQLLSLLGKKHPSYAPELVQPDPTCTAPRDLANMCAAWALCTDDVYMRVDAPRARMEESDPAAPILHYQGQGSGCLLLVRDSFGEALAPFAAAPFAHALVLHGNALGQGALEQLEQVPEVVVLEAGERFSDTLLDQADRVLAWVQGRGEEPDMP